MAIYKPPAPTRLLAKPEIAADGTVHATSTLTPIACKTRGRLAIPPSQVIPIVLIPGIMGTNLRANTVADRPMNTALSPGEPAWRPPNGIKEGISEVSKWEGRIPSVRQQILNGPSLEVDSNGPIILSSDARSIGLSMAEARKCGWGEVHAESYGQILFALRKYFYTFWDCSDGGNAKISEHWSDLNKFGREGWDAKSDGALRQFSEEELRRLAQFHYPIYAAGYNWLQSNAISAIDIATRVSKIIEYWKGIRQKCDGVILLTHSMGGLVGRACAKEIPEKIIGVVHVCMPALGAPVCYRRISCGTEDSSPLNSSVANVKAEKFATIAGRTAEETTPVMAFSAGALELLPTHRYPNPWLVVSDPQSKSATDVNLINGNPYDLYRDFKSWFRLFNIDLADPAKMHGEDVSDKICEAIADAENFHRNILDVFYHQNTYAFFGADGKKTSYGKCRWLWQPGSEVLKPDIIQAKAVEDSVLDSRFLKLASGKNQSVQLARQDSSGDGTVPTVSAASATSYVKGVFPNRGVDHQAVFSNDRMLKLTLQLIGRAVLEKP